MPEETQEARKLRSILGDKVRDALGVDGPHALFTPACLMPFADLDLAASESSCISALSAYLANAPQGSRVTTRRQSRDQILATFRAPKLSAQAVTAVLGCLAYVAIADGEI